MNTNIIQLPSNNCFGYNSEIEIKNMTVKDEKLLSQMNKSNFTKMMMKLFKNLIVNCDDDYVENMLITDGNYLYMKIREYTYTSKYDINMVCEKCNESFKTEIDLPDDLDLTLADEKKIENENEITIKLPKSGDEIVYAFARYKDQLKIETNIKRLKKKDKGIEYVFLIAYNTKMINGDDLTMIDKLSYFDKMSSYDYNYLQEYANELTSGVSPYIYLECPECGYESEYLMPVTEHFFRPKLIRKSK